MTPCEHCNDTGWLVKREDGNEVAIPCTCRTQAQLATRQNSANIPARFMGKYLDRSFVFDRESGSKKAAWEQACKWVAEYPAIQKGLIFQGSTGVGKTLLLCAIANHLLRDHAADVYYIDWNELVREMRSGEDNTNRDFATIEQVLNRLTGVDLLLFDEIGASKPSPYVEDNIYFVINRRYNASKLTLFATNFHDKKIGAEETLVERVGQRIRSRICEMADVVEIRGKDYRQHWG